MHITFMAVTSVTGISSQSRPSNSLDQSHSHVKCEMWSINKQAVEKILIYLVHAFLCYFFVILLYIQMNFILVKITYTFWLGQAKMLRLCWDDDDDYQNVYLLYWLIVVKLMFSKSSLCLFKKFIML